MNITNLSIAGLLALTSCASIVEGKMTNVEVVPNPRTATNVNCHLQNSRGAWDVSAPGSVSVIRSKTDMDISCTDQTTGAKANKTAESDVEAWFFGNLLIPLWPIWMIVDASTGDMWDYDKTITVNMPVTAAPSMAPSQPAAPMFVPPVAPAQVPVPVGPKVAPDYPQARH